MRQLAVISALFLPAIGLAADPVKLPPKEKVHLFLLVGQSNMAGRGVVGKDDQKPHPRVVMLDKAGQWTPAIDPMHFDKSAAGVGLGRTFGIEIANGDPSITVGLIPCAVGGSPIDVWKPGAFYAATKSHPWDDAIKRAKVAMTSGMLKGILWHQGESDSNGKLAKAYEAKLDDLIGRMRKELEAPDCPFIVGQMGQFQGKLWDESHKIVDKAHRELPSRVKKDRVRQLRQVDGQRRQGPLRFRIVSRVRQAIRGGVQETRW